MYRRLDLPESNKVGYDPHSSMTSDRATSAIPYATTSINLSPLEKSQIKNHAHRSCNYRQW